MNVEKVRFAEQSNIMNYINNKKQKDIKMKLISLTGPPFPILTINPDGA